ncbi:MAG TPA: C39 family peptidase [Vicinamibacterales bacterium]|nr:C39 family peptidase [Vicinamibacterales bacterium]
MLVAYRQADAVAPLSLWSGEGCVIAARLASHVGAIRLGARLSVRGWRSRPFDPEAKAQYAYELARLRGSLALWRFLRSEREHADSGPERAELLGLLGRAAAELRDFETADGLLSRAESSGPANAWTRLQRAYILEAEDRLEEALEAAHDACARHPYPYYRPGVQVIAHLLQQLDRDNEAIELLYAAAERLQNGPVLAQLYALLSENGRWAEAEPVLERFVELSPLLERPGRQWVAEQRARVAYRSGRRAEAARLAALVDTDFHRAFAARLADSTPRPERLQLDVTFVRQHFKTCAPATLAAIGRFFRLPAAHLQLAETICYDGTPHWLQREWAEQNGWHVRSFRITLESAVALIERGIPFAITTVEANSAHMMAVVGIDHTCGYLLLRDPGQPYVVEVEAAPFLERYRPFGPRGTVFIPDGEQRRLEGVELPDAALYDHHHHVSVALERHQREAALAAVHALETASPTDLLTLEARLELAAYDANPAEQQRCLDALIDRFPGAAARILQRFHCMGDASREDRIQYLTAPCTRRDADPALFVALARTLLDDARSHAAARRWLRRAMQRRPMDSSAIRTLADVEWESGNLDEATELYRITAGIESFQEHLYQSWFIACRRTRRSAEALAHLQNRLSRFGSRSDQPALTLAWAWQQMEQPVRAREVLEEAIRQRPESGTLQLRAARLIAELGDESAAEVLLQTARSLVRENDWLRTRAAIAERGVDPAIAIDYARQLLEREPLALDAHAIVARALARREGVGASLTHLRQAVEAFPHHLGLRRMAAEWSRPNGPEAAEQAAAAILQLEPSNAWARRERALALMRLKRGDEALAEASEAARIEPRQTYSFSILGHVCGGSRVMKRHARTFAAQWR